MNQTDGRIERMFRALKAEQKKAFIPFITAGYPDLETSYQAIEAMIQNGANLVEIGVPYSDPSADGPVIMMADEYALNKGVRLQDVFDLAGRVRKAYDAFPMVLLLYFNCIFCYGPDRFFHACQEAGIDGVIIPDLPYEEMDEIREDAGRYGIRMISLVTPVSKGRMEKITQNAEGFLYCVSSLGVTGERAQFATNFGSFFEKLNRYTEIPKAVGFGISTPEQVRELKHFSDGVIIGSAIIHKLQQGLEAEKTAAEIAAAVGDYTREIRQALDE